MATVVPVSVIVADVKSTGFPPTVDVTCVERVTAVFPLCVCCETALTVSPRSVKPLELTTVRSTPFPSVTTVNVYGAGSCSASF